MSGIRQTRNSTTMATRECREDLPAPSSSPTASQSAFVRAMARQLQLLQDIDVIEQCVKDAIEQTPLIAHHVRRAEGQALTNKIEASWKRWRRHGDRQSKSHAIRTAQLVDNTFAPLVGEKRRRRKNKKASDFSIFLEDQNEKLPKLQKKASTMVPATRMKASQPIDSLATNLVSIDKKPNGVPQTIDMKPPCSSPVKTQSATYAAALISDTEASPTSVSEEDVEVEKQLAIIDFWPNLLEAMNLQVSSRTTTVVGRKKKYEIYKLAGPCMPATDLSSLRQRLAQQFLDIFDVCHTARHAHDRECRVFAIRNINELWIQINIGRPVEVIRDELSSGRKQPKTDNEFVAMIVPESNLVALTASRAASRSLYTPYVLFALENVLTCCVVGGYSSAATSKRMNDLSGTEPTDLFRTARAIEASDALGRFAQYASLGSSTDPLTDLHAAANDAIVIRSPPVISATKSCTNDTSASETATRKRVRHEELGDNGDCPKRQCVKWDWKGISTVANNEFKCRLTVKGSDVFAGMQALLDAGVMTGPLPHYVRDAPHMGGTISVSHGAVQNRESSPSK